MCILPDISASSRAVRAFPLSRQAFQGCERLLRLGRHSSHGGLLRVGLFHVRLGKSTVQSDIRTANSISDGLSSSFSFKRFYFRFRFLSFRATILLIANCASSDSSRCVATAAAASTFVVQIHVRVHRLGPRLHVSQFLGVMFASITVRLHGACVRTACCRRHREIEFHVFPSGDMLPAMRADSASQ